MSQACDKTPKKNDPTPNLVVDAGNPDKGTASETLPDKPVVKLEVKDVGPAAPTLFVLNGMKGYTEPCGCTLDVMAGGIDRIAGYIDARAKMAPASGVIDGGNIWFEAREVRDSRLAQEKLKVGLLADSYKQLGVSHSVPGPNDFALGVSFYKEIMGRAEISARAVNLSLEGTPLEGSVIKELGGVKVGIVFAVDEALFEGIEGVDATGVEAPLKAEVKKVKQAGAEAIVLVFQGEMKLGKTLVAEVPDVDFLLSSYEPEETDRVDTLDRTHAMQVFDQGRYVGVLKLYSPDGVKGDDTFVNARTGSKAELESVERQIEYVNGNINKLPPAAPGEESPMLTTLRKRLDGLKLDRERLKVAAVDVPEDKHAFVWQSVRMDEGYPENAQIKASKVSTNKEIKRVNASQDFDVVPVEEGSPFYVGNAQCKTCHTEAYAFWEKTNHGHAFETLVEKDKEYDQTCVSCHVVGFEKPGGSVLGKLDYAVELVEGKGYQVQKDLKNVGCENCHGPGSAHVEAALFGEKGDPKQFINNVIDANTCMESCHVTEHSPRFNFDVYVQQVTGEGHARRSAQ